MSDTIKRTGTTVTLVYSPEGSNRVVKRIYTGLTEDDIVAVSAALAGRRISLPEVRDNDFKQLRDARHRQMGWYADRMIEALYDGLGRWYKLIPLRVRANTVQLLMDYLRDITKVWTNELVAAHAATSRIHEQATALRLRPVPAAEPLIPCRCCDATFERADFLPEGWTADDDGVPRCPAHRVVRLVKEAAA